MSEKYWGTFVVTGRVADYLNYRNAKEKSDNNQDDQGLKAADIQTGAKKHESDCSDRDGAVSSTYR